MNVVFTSAPLVPGVRLVRVFWRLLTPLAVVLCLHLVPGWLGASDALAEQARRSSWFVLAYALAVALTKEVLSPLRPGLRLVKVGDSRAERISNILKGLAFVVLATELAIWLIHVNGWSPAAARLFEVARNAGLVLVGAALLARLGLLLDPAALLPRRHHRLRPLAGRLRLRRRPHRLRLGPGLLRRGLGLRQPGLHIGARRPLLVELRPHRLEEEPAQHRGEGEDVRRLEQEVGELGAHVSPP